MASLASLPARRPERARRRACPGPVPRCAQPWLFAQPGEPTGYGQPAQYTSPAALLPVAARAVRRRGLEPAPRGRALALTLLGPVGSCRRPPLVPWPLPAPVSGRAASSLCPAVEYEVTVHRAQRARLLDLVDPRHGGSRALAPAVQYPLGDARPHHADGEARRGSPARPRGRRSRLRPGRGLRKSGFQA